MGNFFCQHGGDGLLCNSRDLFAWTRRSFLQQWMKKERGLEASKLDLFSNATRASNKLVFVAPLDGIQDRDFSQCKVTVGSGALEQAVQMANGDCSAKDLTKFAQIVEPFLVCVTSHLRGRVHA